MPWRFDLSKELLVHVLNLSTDASVLHFAAASRAVRNAVEECREIGSACSAGSHGPWRHPPATWEVSGLWRFLGLGDLKKIPKVTLCCETEFQHSAELLAFLKAVKALAADTVDGHVTFSNFSFPPTDAAELFHGEDEFMTTSGQVATVVFNGYHIECSIDAHLWIHEGEVPTINLWVHENEKGALPENLLICCSSLLAPELRLLASCGENMSEELDLDSESPFTELVRASKPLPMLLGVWGFASSG